MNYFAHALCHLDRPWFMVGAAVPDLLSVVDRAVRVRPKGVDAFLTDAEGVQREVALGIRQHFFDDDWFHRTRGFAEVTALMTVQFRELLAGGDGFRCGFLGHITTEMLLDAVLIRQFPAEFEAYYRQLATIQPETVQATVNQMARGQTLQLAAVIHYFAKEQFLRDYQTDQGLLWRLNHVQARVKLAKLPVEAVAVLAYGRDLIANRVRDLLPQETYPNLPVSTCPG